MEIKDRKENTQLKIIQLLLRKVFNKETLHILALDMFMHNVDF